LSLAICLPLNISTPPLTNLSRNAGIRDCYIFDLGYKSFCENCTQLRDIWDALAGDTTKAVRPVGLLHACCGVYCGTTTTAVPTIHL
jgi:hypothetical protein